MAAMPCSGLADCGVCAVPARRGYKLACKDGPVFDLDELDWRSEIEKQGGFNEPV
jgi:NAD(P)H-flavin reductase